MQSQEDKSSWPTSSMLWIGTFGPGSPGGRSYQTACYSALGVLLLGVLLLTPFSKAYPILRWPLGILPGVVFTFIAWRLWLYVSQLDELSRRLQMEAMAITYLIGMAASLLLGGLALVFNWNINPGLYLFLDIIRAFVLVKLARRYA